MTIMARKPYRGRAFLKGKINESLALSTLASATLIGDTWDDTVNERTLVTSIVANWMLDDATVNEGPIVFGVAHADYTDAEIEAWIETLNTWNEGNLISKEIANRKIRQIGTFSLAESDEQFNNGLPVKTKLNWVILQAQGLRMWAYNRGGAVMTTGAVLRAEGHANLKPL